MEIQFFLSHFISNISFVVIPNNKLGLKKDNLLSIRIDLTFTPYIFLEFLFSVSDCIVVKF
jgi:hypothetical protein